MEENLWAQIFWVVCVATAIVASVLAIWRPRARYIGRVAVGMLMLLGGAAFNAVNLALGDYAGFADQAHFGWVTGARLSRRTSICLSVCWWRSRQSSAC
jgi:hypothetical protein